MPICYPKQNLYFFPIPKTASSAIKKFLFPYETHAGRLHKNAPAVQFAKISDEQHKQMQNCRRIALIRDPIERVISCHRQKIQDATRERLTTLFKEDQHNLVVKPTLSQFIDNIELYIHSCGFIRHHVAPTTFFLGLDPSYFTKIYKMSEIHLLIKELESCTVNNSADDFLPRNVTKTKSKPEQVYSYQLEKLRAMFQEDYSLFEFDEFNLNNHMNLIIK
jgi:hypothetical protein